MSTSCSIRRSATSAACSAGASERQYRAGSATRASGSTAPIYAAFAGRGVAELAKDPKALALGRSLFANNCTNCHGSDARGASAFPNLTDNDWLYGGAPENIVETITHGREGVMPALGAGLGPQGVDEVVAYVVSLSGRPAPADNVAAGKARFALCAACHGADGKGNQAIGAPNLTDDIWLYGGSPEAIRTTIMQGRHGQMPAHDWLGETACGCWRPTSTACRTVRRPARLRRARATADRSGVADVSHDPLVNAARLARWLIGAVLWSSFLAACLASLLFFAAVDPLLLRDAGPQLFDGH